MRTVYNRRSLVLVLAVALILAAASAVALAADDNAAGGNIDQILQQIEQKQGVSSLHQIDPDQVSDQDLEKLGEAVMDYEFTDQREHEYMDRMMGGEDSQSLAAMHRLMGYRYLTGEVYDGPGYAGHGYPGGGWFMGPGMMGWHMGWPEYGSSWGHGRGFWPGAIVTWVVVVGLIVLMVILIARASRRRSGGKSISALEIARNRYARGEISREEYERIRHDLS